MIVLYLKSVYGIKVAGLNGWSCTNLLIISIAKKLKD
jgi:hypothetical protein